MKDLGHSYKESPSGGKLPLWLKLGFSLWVLLWAPTYAIIYGPQNYFWLCNLANYLLLIMLLYPLLLCWPAHLLTLWAAKWRVYLY